MPLEKLLDLSLPFAEISYEGKVCVAKAEGSGGVLNFSTCAQQLLYEIGDPSAYITPDVVSHSVLKIHNYNFGPSVEQLIFAIFVPKTYLLQLRFLFLFQENDCIFHI